VPALAGTVIGIMPIPFVIFVIVEFHALNDVIAEPDTDIGVRLDVARCGEEDIDRFCPAMRVDCPGEPAGNLVEPGGPDLQLHDGFVRAVQGLGDARARAGLG